jgi:hypothetical protein
MFPEKHQANAVYFNGTPGMGLHQIGKILFPLFQGQFIGATIESFTDSPHGARIRVNGILTFALKFERTQVTLIKFIKSVRFGFFHGIPPSVFMAPGIGHCWELYNDLSFISAAWRLRPTKGIDSLNSFQYKPNPDKPEPKKVY